MILAVYVDNILATDSDLTGIPRTKDQLQKHFVTKDMGRPKYFLDIEFAYTRDRMALSQRKYILETGLLGCKPESTLFDQSLDFWDSSLPLLEDAGRYRRLVGKLIYLTVIRPDIAYIVGVLSQFMQEPRIVHWLGVIRVLAYVKKAPGKGLMYKKNGHLLIETYSDSDYAGDKDRKSTSGYCTYVGGNLVMWRSKKQNVISRSNAESEYKSMTQTACEMM